MSSPSLSTELHRAEIRHFRTLLVTAQALESRGMSSEAVWTEFYEIRRYRQFARNGLQRPREFPTWPHDGGRNPTKPG